MAFQILKKSCCSKPYTNFTKLPVGDYLVSDFIIVDTKFGKKLRVDIGDKLILLPERFTCGLTPAHIEELNNTTMWMCYRGKDADNHNM